MTNIELLAAKAYKEWKAGLHPDIKIHTPCYSKAPWLTKQGWISKIQQEQLHGSIASFKASLKKKQSIKVLNTEKQFPRKYNV